MKMHNTLGAKATSFVVFVVLMLMMHFAATNTGYRAYFEGSRAFALAVPMFLFAAMLFCLSFVARTGSVMREHLSMLSALIVAGAAAYGGSLAWEEYNAPMDWDAVEVTDQLAPENT